MKEMKARYAALGLRRRPASVEEIERRYFVAMERWKDSTKTHRAARRMLREARAACLQEIGND